MNKSCCCQSHSILSRKFVWRKISKIWIFWAMREQGEEIPWDCDFLLVRTSVRDNLGSLYLFWIIILRPKYTQGNSRHPCPCGDNTKNFLHYTFVYWHSYTAQLQKHKNCKGRPKKLEKTDWKIEIQHCVDFFGAGSTREWLTFVNMLWKFIIFLT